MILPFYKYQGTGNDFIIINQLVVGYMRTPEASLIESLCSRKFGIGCDGLIILEESKKADFRMTYYNADGHESTMCGNGGRCVAHLAQSLKLFRRSCRFEAIDGIHEATVHDNGIVELKMGDVSGVERSDDGYVLNTGSPHIVVPVENLEDMDVFKEGRRRRHEPPFTEDGINVNFIEKRNDGIFVRTYERGVEDETLSCGTGVTACALVTPLIYSQWQDANTVKVMTRGGELSVRFRNKEGSFQDIWLTGPATKVYEGQINL